MMMNQAMIQQVPIQQQMNNMFLSDSDDSGDDNIQQLQSAEPEKKKGFFASMIDKFKGKAENDNKKQKKVQKKIQKP